jgi:hypothetical protein
MVKVALGAQNTSYGPEVVENPQISMLKNFKKIKKNYVIGNHRSKEQKSEDLILPSAGC